MTDYASRQDRLRAALAASNVDLLFVPPSANLEYLAGVRRSANWGRVLYSHAWLCGGYFPQEGAPVFLFPRMFAEFDLKGMLPPNTVVVAESDDPVAALRSAVELQDVVLALPGRAMAETVLRLQDIVPLKGIVNGDDQLLALRSVKGADEIALIQRACDVVDRTMPDLVSVVEPGRTVRELISEVEERMRAHGADGTSFETHIFTGGLPDSRNSEVPATRDWPIREGESVLFDFGATLDGYCSDFGRTVFCGEPTNAYFEAEAAMLAAEEAGREAARPGARAAEVNAACRAPIEAAGLGSYFRHRMGHGIGMEIHERPFISEEDETVLAAGMVFTDEPSIVWPGQVGIRIENVIVCEPDGARRLNVCPLSLS